MAWPIVKLKDCCAVVGGATPKRNVPKYWGHDVPWITPKDISNLNQPVLEDAPEYISKRGFDSSATFMLPKDSILLTSRAPIGNVAIAGRSMCTNQGFKSLIPSDRVDSSYLYHCIKKMSKRLQALGNGATFKEVSKKVVEEFEIPLPPLSEQKRIAAILDKADTIRRKRQQAIDLTDQLLRSVFLDMFGDPVTNPKGWRMLPIGEIADVKTGGTPSRKNSDNYDGNIPWVKTGEVDGDIIVNTSENITEKGLNSSNCVLFPPYSIVIAMYGQGKTRGRSAMLGISATTNQACAVILPNGKVNQHFLWEYLRLSYEQIRELGRGGNQPNLNLSLVKNFKVFVPPLDTQKIFVGIVNKMRESNTHSLDSKNLSDELFYSLSKRAFRGELIKQTKAA